MEQLMTYGVTQQERQEAAGTVAMRSGAAYEMAPGEIARARAFARDFLATAQSSRGWSVSDRARDAAQLVVSELATNVCKYAPGPCLLDLQTDGTMLDISMWDTGSVLPSVSPADPTRVGQHGLELVLLLCQSFEIRREPVGKRVRVQVSLLDSPDESPSGRSVW